MRPEVQKKIESREACDNLYRLAAKYNRFASVDTCEIPEKEDGPEQDEVIFVPEDYYRRQSILANIAATLLNMMSLGMFSRIGSVSKYMHG